MIVLQLILFCALFTLMVKIGVGNNALNGLYFYPKPVQEKVYELGLTDRETLEIMNWYDGIVIDRLWVGHSRFWVIPGTEEIPFVQTWPQVLKKRGILTLIWIAGAALIAGIVVLL